MPLSYNKFTTATATSTKEDILKHAFALRNAMAEECAVQLSEAELHEDNIRIKHTVDFLMDVENDFEFYIANKPLTASCEEAAKFRVDHKKILQRDMNRPHFPNTNKPISHTTYNR